MSNTRGSKVEVYGFGIKNWTLEIGFRGWSFEVQG